MISHKYKFIFIRIPKTGSSSILSALWTSGLQRYFKNTKKFTKKYTIEGDKVHHKKAIELYQIDEFNENWDNYFKFAFVRNPWDLIVSWFSFYNTPRRRKQGTSVSFDEWIERKIWQNKLEFRQCYDRIYDNNDKLMIDYVGKLEFINIDFKRICKKIGIKQTLEHKNRSRHKPYQYYYNEKTKQVIANLFHKDIELFKYKF